MTKGEAIDLCMEVRHYLTSGNPIWDKDKVGEALDMAIETLQTPPITQRSMYQKGYAQGREEALEGVCFDEWCTDCKEYDTEKNCCPRFNRVIREAINREPSADGTLEVKVEDATKVGRVLISDDEHRGGLYYPDEYEPKGEDLISRAEAIEAITGALDAIDHVPKWVFDKLTCAINILPSADRPKDGDLISRAEAIEALGEEPPVWCDEEYEIAERSQWRADIEAIKSVPSADRPRGEWIEMIDCDPITGEPYPCGVRCSNCGDTLGCVADFCPNCGADMRGDTK